MANGARRAAGPGAGGRDRAEERETFTLEFPLLTEQLRSSTERGSVFTFRDFSRYSLIERYVSCHFFSYFFCVGNLLFCLSKVFWEE